MNSIIGTAGHVDHGKSTLIKALTGMSMMRLPEEQKRGMTIDLGFGYFSPSENINIGVIDVPGHERFIRNMVAGMWSLDLVMIVVCANEGWMNMTEEHSKVAYALGIKNIICVINKIDLVDSDNLIIQEENIKQNLNRIFKIEIETIKVSSTNGDNIDHLKNRITEIITKNKIAKKDNTHIYVDRVFSVKGAGLTITGSIVDGKIEKEDTLIHYPTKKEISIRNIQSYHKDRDIVESTSRVALNLRGLEKSEIRRGHLLATKKETLFSTTEIILELIEELNDIEYLKKIKNAEFAIGTECLIAEIIPIYKKKNNNDKEIDNRFIRLKFKEAINVFWKDRGILISHGGSKIIGSGYIFFGDETNNNMRTALLENAGDFLGDNIDSSRFIDLSLSIKGYINYHNHNTENAIKINDFLVSKKYLEKVDSTINKLILFKKDNITFDDIRNYYNIDNEFTKIIIEYLINKKIIMTFNGIYKKYVENVSLTNSQKTILEKLKKEELNGIDEKYLKTIPNAIKDIKTLVTLKQAMYLDEGIYYHIDTYKKIKDIIMKGLKSKDIITIAYVKDKTGLSRKYTIPILNALEREKILKRVGNDREVL